MALSVAWSQFGVSTFDCPVHTKFFLCFNPSSPKGGCYPSGGRGLKMAMFIDMSSDRMIFVDAFALYRLSFDLEVLFCFFLVSPMY